MVAEPSQHEIKSPSPLLDARGDLVQVGWARHPLLDANLENARIYRGMLSAILRLWQRFRIKRWDYYGVTTPTHFFSATLADLGYAGQAFVYLINFATGRCQEQTVTVPLARGINLPRGSTAGESHFYNGKVRLAFSTEPAGRRVEVNWRGFAGAELAAELFLRLAPEHESTVILIPIRGHRFYYNRKINCLPAEGHIRYGGQEIAVRPDESLGNLDWGRGIWEYRSFWVWASASGYLPGGGAIGLNLGYGFGDTSAATENTLLLDGRIHKLGQVDFSYDPRDFKRPWHMRSPDGRLDLEFVPFLERLARTNLLVITSEVHQMFGRYQGTVCADDGHVYGVDNLVGFAEEHHAHW